jgi:hypothetical protein
VWHLGGEILENGGSRDHVGASRFGGRDVVEEVGVEEEGGIGEGGVNGLTSGAVHRRWGLRREAPRRREAFEEEGAVAGGVGASSVERDVLALVPGGVGRVTDSS